MMALLSNRRFHSPPFKLPDLRDASKEIRLLHIFPIKRDEDATIRCEITVHDSQSIQGSYTAISYTWGPAKPTRRIEVNGSRVSVRYNCWYALWQMRLHSVSNLYWLDTLCIDQDNHAEKALQVRRMDLIYSEAEQVAACIGDSRSDEWLYIGRQRGESNPRAPVFQPTSIRSYFRRAWTVQECLLAKDLQLFCGRHRSPINATVAHRIRHSGNIARLHSSTSQEGVDHEVQFLANFLEECSLAQGKALDQSISVRQPHQIIPYFSRDCYDPRDKLYAVLSLLGPAFRERVPIKYDQSLLHVLMDFSNVYESLTFRQTGDGSPPTLLNLVAAVSSLRSEFALSAGFKESEDSFLREWFTIYCENAVSLQRNHGLPVGTSHTMIIGSFDILFPIEPSFTGDAKSRLDSQTRLEINQDAIVPSKRDACNKEPRVLKDWQETLSPLKLIPRYYLRPAIRSLEGERCPLPRSIVPQCAERCAHNTYGTLLRVGLSGSLFAFMVPADTAVDDLVLHHDGIFFVCKRTLLYGTAAHIVGEAIPLIGTSPLETIEPFDPASRTDIISRCRTRDAKITMPPADMLSFCLSQSAKSIDPSIVRFLVRTPIKSACIDLPVVPGLQADVSWCSLERTETFTISEQTIIADEQYRAAMEEEQRQAQGRVELNDQSKIGKIQDAGTRMEEQQELLASLLAESLGQKGKLTDLLGDMDKIELIADLKSEITADVDLLHRKLGKILAIRLRYKLVPEDEEEASLRGELSIKNAMLETILRLESGDMLDPLRVPATEEIIQGPSGLRGEQVAIVKRELLARLQAEKSERRTQRLRRLRSLLRRAIGRQQTGQLKQCM